MDLKNASTSSSGECLAEAFSSRFVKKLKNRFKKKPKVQDHPLAKQGKARGQSPSAKEKAHDPEALAQVLKTKKSAKKPTSIMGWNISIINPALERAVLAKGLWSSSGSASSDNSEMEIVVKEVDRYELEGGQVAMDLDAQPFPPYDMGATSNQFNHAPVPHNDQAFQYGPTPMVVDVQQVPSSNVATVSYRSSTESRDYNVIPVPPSNDDGVSSQSTLISSAPITPISRVSNASAALNNAAAIGIMRRQKRPKRPRKARSMRMGKISLPPLLQPWLASPETRRTSNY